MSQSIQVANMLLLLVAILASGSLAMKLCHGSDGAQYQGSYVEGSGVYIASDNVTKPYEFPWIRKCWYEYYLISSSLYDAPWRLSTGEINCEGTSTCTVTSFNGTEFCQSRTSTISIKMGMGSALLGLSAGYTLSLTSEGCYAATNTNACQWSDGGCHTIWTQQQLLKQVGYLRQRCNDGQKKNNKKIITHCMADFETDNTPTQLTNYACGAQCGVQYVGLNAPGSSSTISQPSSATTFSAAAAQSTVNNQPTKSSSSTLNPRVKLGSAMGAIAGVVLALVM